jgi:hypothetical protein
MTELFLICKPAVVGEDYSFVLVPNQAQKLSVKVTNPTAIDATVSSKLRDFSLGESSLGLSEWSNFSEQSYELKAGETKELLITITPPKTAAAGGYYAFLTHEFRGENAEASGSAMIDQAGTAIYALIGGEMEEEIELIEWRVDKLWEKEPVEYQLVLKNTANFHLTPSGTVTVYRGEREVSSSKIEAETALLPQATQAMTGEMVTDHHWGKFRARVEIVYGSENTQMIVAEKEFWVFPLRLILLGVLCLIVVLVLAGKIIKKKSK